MKRSFAPVRSIRPFITRTDADDAAVLVEVGVEDQRLQRLVGVARRGRDPLDDGVEQLGHALAGLGADAQDLVGGDAEHVLDLGAYRSGSAAGRSILLRQATISRSFSSAR
jgi:hypothetical protein